MLSKEEVRRLQELDWQGHEAGLVEHVPARSVVVPGGGKRWALASREDGACIYLSSRQRCLLHEHFGLQAKPLLCRLFPFGFSAVGDKVAVEVSFACRAVREEQGSPLSASVRDWEALFAEGGAITGHTAHRFSKKYTVDGELLWELERLVLEMLSHGSLSLLDRVRGVLELLRLGMTSNPRTDAASRLREIMAKAIPKQLGERPFEATLDETQRSVFFHLVFLSLNPTPRSFSNLSASARKKEVRRRVAAADAFHSRDASPWVDNKECAASFATVARTSPGWLLETPGESLVVRYVSSKIVGQRFLREGERELTFVEAMPRLVLLVPMICWTAMAMAAGRNRDRVRREDVLDALCLVDRSYGQVRLSDLPKGQRKAWSFVLEETDLAPTVLNQLLEGSL
jgi:hypothetical protein